MQCWHVAQVFVSRAAACHAHTVLQHVQLSQLLLLLTSGCILKQPCLDLGCSVHSSAYLPPFVDLMVTCLGVKCTCWCETSGLSCLRKNYWECDGTTACIVKGVLLCWPQYCDFSVLLVPQNSSMLLLFPHPLDQAVLLQHNCRWQCFATWLPTLPVCSTSYQLALAPGVLFCMTQTLVAVVHVPWL